MDTKLFNAVIAQAVQDLFSKDHQREAYAWFMDDENVKTQKNKLTFLECCDYTNRSPHPMRRLVEAIIAKRVDKNTVLYYFG